MKAVWENLAHACDSTCVDHVRPSITMLIFAVHVSLCLVCFAGQV